MKSLDEQSVGQSWNREFFVASKLVYFKTQILVLVESSMEVPTCSILRQEAEAHVTEPNLQRS